VPESRTGVLGDERARQYAGREANELVTRQIGPPVDVTML